MAKIRLQSGDLREFVVEVELANRSVTLKNMLSDCGVEVREEGNEEVIPIPNVDGDSLENVLKWMEYHKNDESLNWEEGTDGKVEIGEWDAAFLDGYDRITIFQLIEAANYLDIKPLMDVACQKIANMLKGKDEEGMRAMLLPNVRETKVVKLCADDVPHVMLRSADAIAFQVETQIAELIPKVKELMMKNGVEEGVGEVIPASKCYSGMLQKVIEWAKLTKDNPPKSSNDEGRQNSDDISEENRAFLNEHLTDAGDLFETLVVARDLGVQDLEKLIATKIANIIACGKSTEEIRAVLNLKNDFTPEQLHFIQLENKWVAQNQN